MKKFNVNEFFEWAEKTFPKSTTESILNHLKSEIDELRGAVNLLSLRKHSMLQDKVFEEIADIVLLMYHLSYKLNHDFDIETELAKKAEINYNRKWGEPNEQGFVEHIKSEEK